jgi:hypothetical protein
MASSTPTRSLGRASRGGGKVSQAGNLNTWPVILFVGRNGLIKGIHSGLASQASGDFNDQLTHEFTAKMKRCRREHSHAERLRCGGPSNAAIATGMNLEGFVPVDPVPLRTAS